MRNRQVYEKVRKLILEVLPAARDPRRSESAGEVAVSLMRQKHAVLHDLDIIPEKQDDWK